jgi:hypothetical protein
VVRVEFLVPLLFGVLLALVGLVLVFDAWRRDELVMPRERRRRPRAERDRTGEAFIGLGIIAVGAAFMGRDVWSYRIVAVVVGAVLMLMGAIRNRHLLHDLVANRGKLRRGAPAEVLAEPDAPQPAATGGDSSQRLRIR